MSDESARLSNKLCEVLERVGVSDNMRKIYHETSIVREIVESLFKERCERNKSTYSFGSSCEGTTTPSMGSDLDFVQCIGLYPVIQDSREAPPGVSLLMVTDRHTQPGYVKLQMVVDGIPLTRRNHYFTETELSYDCQGRVCLRHLMITGTIINERNGPADTISNNPDVIPTDLVAALRCKTFPQTARLSFVKCILCGWLSREDVERLKSMGVLLVGTGHPASKERDIEWRISFSFQERHLMQTLNPVQHKCCVMLKIIKNIITANLGGKKCLTSYHCKTCLFTVITETSLAMWKDENLSKCIYICLNKLIDWISHFRCPNFFIEQSNMFERQEFVMVQERLLCYLRGIVDQGPSMLYTIQSDDIGQALQGRACRQIDDRRIKQEYLLLINMCESICRYQNDVLARCNKLHCSPTRYLFQHLCFMTSVDTVTEHTHEQTQMTVRLLLPIIHKLYAQQLASVAFSDQHQSSRQRLLEVSARHLIQGKKCDRLTGHLLEVTILYRGGHLESCRDLLDQIERFIQHGGVVSHCKCFPHVCFLNEHIKQKISSGKLYLQNMMELAVAPCMMFLPSQTEIIPKALQYEMYRSVGASPETIEEPCELWYDLAVVDSKIYLFFMQYLVYTDLNQQFSKQIAIDQIWKTLQDQNESFLGASSLGHRETAYNLLGWIYKQEGQIQEALECFRRSWRIRPDHNAAKWHVLELYKRMNRQ